MQLSTQPKDLDYLYKPSELCTIFRWSLVTIRRKLRNGQIPSIKINDRGDYRIKKSEVQKLLKSYERNS